MKGNKSSVFQNIMMALLALCVVVIAAIMVYQLTIGNKQIILLETELNMCKNQIKSQENALTEAKEQLGQYETQLGQYQEQLTSYAEQIEDMHTDGEKTNAVSSTKEYAAWVAAQSALEPYDLYYDLQHAYEQLMESDSNYLIGTKKYKTALNLLVPKIKRRDLTAYMATLDRYFGSSDISTVRYRIIDDLVAAKLLIEKGNDYYEWNKSFLSTEKVMSKLNLTEDVANALIGLLRTMDWDV